VGPEGFVVAALERAPAAASAGEGKTTNNHTGVRVDGLGTRGFASLFVACGNALAIVLTSYLSRVFVELCSWWIQTAVHRVYQASGRLSWLRHAQNSVLRIEVQRPGKFVLSIRTCWFPVVSTR
jgi:hypothetical protein